MMTAFVSKINKLMSMKKLILSAKSLICAVLVSVVILPLSGCYLLPKEEAAIAPPLKEPEKVTFNTVAVKRGTVEQTVSSTGYFISSSQTNLAFKYREGYLKTLNVETGSGVRMNHNDLKSNETVDGIKVDGKKDFTVKKGDVLAELDTDSLVNDIKLQEVKLKKAQLAGERLKTIHSVEGGGDKYELQQSELDVDEAQINLENLQMELDKSKLVSPVDGVVDFIDEVKVGDFIDANRTIIRIIDPKQLVLESNGQSTSGLKFGMQVNVEIKGKIYKGEVVMAPTNITTSDYDKVKDYGNEQEYSKMLESIRDTIKVKVNDLPSDVVLGDSAKISASIVKRENVLTLPKNVVHTFENRKFVKVLKNNIVYERDVELGIESVTNYEIVKGLEEGDQVIS